LPIWSRRWPSLDYTIEAAPLDKGVFGLWKNNELIFIGVTDADGSIRQCLMAHHSGEHGNETQEADHYSWEVANDPAERHREVVAQYQRTHGRPPRLNAEVGAKKPK
jgi:hypothetical protein